MDTEVRKPNEAKTQAGNYFVSNYPPYSFWSQDRVAEAFEALDRLPAPNTPLGVYLHLLGQNI